MTAPTYGPNDHSGNQTDVDSCAAQEHNHVHSCAPDKQKHSGICFNQIVCAFFCCQSREETASVPDESLNGLQVE